MIFEGVRIGLCFFGGFCGHCFEYVSLISKKNNKTILVNHFCTQMVRGVNELYNRVLFVASFNNVNVNVSVICSVHGLNLVSIA